MSRHGEWEIIDGVARRTYNGQEITVERGRDFTVRAAIEEWEREERQRILRELGALGRVVDAALDRLLK